MHHLPLTAVAAAKYLGLWGQISSLSFEACVQPNHTATEGTTHLFHKQCVSVPVIPDLRNTHTGGSRFIRTRLNSKLDLVLCTLILKATSQTRNWTLPEVFWNPHLNLCCVVLRIKRDLPVSWIEVTSFRAGTRFVAWWYYTERNCCDATRDIHFVLESATKWTFAKEKYKWVMLNSKEQNPVKMLASTFQLSGQNRTAEIEIGKTLQTYKVQFLIKLVRIKCEVSVQEGNTRKEGHGKKWNSVFWSKTCIVDKFWPVFVVTYRVTNFLPKLLNMLLFSAEKTEFPFFEIPYFRVLPYRCTCIIRDCQNFFVQKKTTKKRKRNKKKQKKKKKKNHGKNIEIRGNQGILTVLAKGNLVLNCGEKKISCFYPFLWCGESPHLKCKGMTKQQSSPKSVALFHFTRPQNRSNSEKFCAWSRTNAFQNMWTQQRADFQTYLFMCHALPYMLCFGECHFCQNSFGLPLQPHTQVGLALSEFSQVEIGFYLKYSQNHISIPAVLFCITNYQIKGYLLGFVCSDYAGITCHWGFKETWVWCCISWLSLRVILHLFLFKILRSLGDSSSHDERPAHISLP